MASESLKCNAFDSTFTAWVENGVSPYLHDTDADFIEMFGVGAVAKEGYFGFEDGQPKGKVGNVYVWFECQYVVDVKKFKVYYDVGAGDVYAGEITPDAAWSYKSLTITGLTWAQINALKLYVIEVAAGNVAHGVQIRRASLTVNYTPGVVSGNPGLWFMLCEAMVTASERKVRRKKIASASLATAA